MATTINNPYIARLAVAVSVPTIRTPRRMRDGSLRGFTNRRFLFPEVNDNRDARAAGLGQTWWMDRVNERRALGDDDQPWWTQLLNIGAQVGANVTNQKLAQSAYEQQIAQYMRYHPYGQPSSQPAGYGTSIVPGLSNTALLGGALALGLIVVLAMR